VGRRSGKSSGSRCQEVSLRRELSLKKLGGVLDYRRMANSVKLRKGFDPAGGRKWIASSRVKAIKKFK